MPLIPWTSYKPLPFKTKNVPHIDITVINPINDVKTQLPFMIDTGATITAIPSTILKYEIKRKPHRELIINNFDSQKIIKLMYFVHINICGTVIEKLEICGTDNPDYGLLGRDVLDQYILHCDGPNQKFMIE